MDPPTQKLMEKFMEITGRYDDEICKNQNHIENMLNKYHNDEHIKYIYSLIEQFMKNCTVLCNICTEIIERKTMNQEEFENFRATIGDIFRSESQLIVIKLTIQSTIKNNFSGRKEPELSRYRKELKFTENLIDNMLNKICD